jgi:hypothetical protein
MTLDAIKEAIADLPPDDRAALAAWIAEREMDQWDRQMQPDFSPGGRGERLLEKIKADVRAGKFRPMDE